MIWLFDDNRGGFASYLAGGKSYTKVVSGKKAPYLSKFEILWSNSTRDIIGIIDDDGAMVYRNEPFIHQFQVMNCKNNHNGLIVKSSVAFIFFLQDPRLSIQSRSHLNHLQDTRQYFNVNQMYIYRTMFLELFVMIIIFANNHHLFYMLSLILIGLEMLMILLLPCIYSISWS